MKRAFTVYSFMIVPPAVIWTLWDLFHHLAWVP